MKSNDPIDPRVRLEIAQLPDDAPRGAVSTFCAAHGISRKTFYKIRAIARDGGQAAALEPRSRRPRTSARQLDEAIKKEAVKVRAALEASGLDHGPISVHDKMNSMGLKAPSTAALARLFRERGLARAEPRKKPRAAWRRFVYPAPNACWQLDATEYVLTGGRKCVIFQLQDDHSRLVVASLVATGETSEAAVAVAKKGIRSHGVPQRLLTDNGRALTPSRLGQHSQLFTFMSSLGVEVITGKPCKPATQGKNERFHQTLFRYLDKQPIASTMDELQHQVDQFDQTYNRQRPHQGLPGRVTPQQAWDATSPAESPRRPRVPQMGPLPLPETPKTAPAVQHQEQEQSDREAQPRRSAASASGKVSGSLLCSESAGAGRLKVYSNGTVRFNNVVYSLSTRMATRVVIIQWDPEAILFATSEGEVIAGFGWPEPGVKHVGMKSAQRVFG